jgi:hypothetical protein
MTVVELVQHLGTKYPAGHPTNCSRAMTGEPYVVIGLQHPCEGRPQLLGIIDEGKKSIPEFNESAAVIQALACFEQYAAGRSGKLYYRHTPELEWNDQKTHCRVYLRCLVSNKQEFGIQCERCNCGLRRLGYR